jgi:hypothetical protein
VHFQLSNWLRVDDRFNRETPYSAPLVNQINPETATGLPLARRDQPMTRAARPHGGEGLTGVEVPGTKDESDRSFLDIDRIRDSRR